jgi:aminopeptidase 2
MNYDTLLVLRMLSEYVGEERFLEGVTIYLKKKLYGNSVTNDLWDGISTATGSDFLCAGGQLAQVGLQGSMFTASWTTGLARSVPCQYFVSPQRTYFSLGKIGFPLITVTETPSGVHIRQDRFLNNGHPSTEENQTIWFVEFRPSHT